MNAQPIMKKFLKEDIERTKRFGEGVSVQWLGGSPIILSFLREDHTVVMSGEVEKMNVDDIALLLGKFGFHDKYHKFKETIHVPSVFG